MNDRPTGTQSDTTTITRDPTGIEPTARLAIVIRPPFFDRHYANVRLHHDATTTPTGQIVESHADARSVIKDTITSLNNDPETPSVSVSSSHLYLYPGFETELSLPELFGNSTLSAFNTPDPSTGDDAHDLNWYTTTAAYSDWIDPIRTNSRDGEVVLRYTTSGRQDTWSTVWVRDTESGPEWLRYNSQSHRWEREPGEWTKVVREIGAHGLIYPEVSQPGERPETPYLAPICVPDGVTEAGAIGVAHVPIEATPFHDDYTHPYLAGTGHPLEVNGWTFTPDASGFDSWLGPDGVHNVQTRGGTVVIGIDGIMQDLSADLVSQPAAAPDRRADGEDALTRREARELAVTWMEDHPADTYTHPLRRYRDAIHTHPVSTVTGTSLWVKERHSTLSCRITPTTDPETERSYAFGSIEVTGDVTASTAIDPTATTGFTATRKTATGTAPQSDLQTEPITSGSLVACLDAVHDILQAQATDAPHSSNPTV